MPDARELPSRPVRTRADPPSRLLTQPLDLDTPVHAAARAWLLSRVDAECAAVCSVLVQHVADHLATATGDGVGVRALLPDGLTLAAIASSHPDPPTAAAIREVMGRTEQAEVGLWRDVLRAGRPRRWLLRPGEVIAEASEVQSAFVARFAVRALLVVPLLEGPRVVGGIGLVRFVAGPGFGDAEEELALDCARRLAPLLVLQSRLAEP